MFKSDSLQIKGFPRYGIQNGEFMKEILLSTFNLDS